MAFRLARIVLLGHRDNVGSRRTILISRLYARDSAVEISGVLQGLSGRFLPFRTQECL